MRNNSGPKVDSWVTPESKVKSLKTLVKKIYDTDECIVFYDTNNFEVDLTRYSASI